MIADILTPPRDHTRDLLFNDYKHAKIRHQHARANVRDAVRNLELARLAEERALALATEAGAALRLHDPAAYAVAVVTLARDA